MFDGLLTRRSLSVKAFLDATIGWQGAAPETQARLLEDFCSGIRLSTLASNSLTALIVGAFALAETRNPYYFVWLVIALLGGAMPRLYALYLHHEGSFRDAPERKALTFVAISAAYGLVWGAGPLLVLPDLSGVSAGIFLILIIFGTIMGPYAAMPGILYARLLATGIPTLIAIALYIGPKATIVAVILLAWLGLRTDVWRGYHRVLRREIEFRGVLEAQQKELKRTHLATQQANEGLKVLAETDPLTGAANRRQFLHAFESLTGPAAIILFDIDHFKLINDRFGHQVGDSVLVTLPKLIKSGLRDDNLLARLGGDEFALLLPDVTADQAEAIAERIRAAVDCYYMNANNERLQFTISLGVATLPDGALRAGADEILRHADKLLYAAKSQGRNRICAGTPESLAPLRET